MPNATVREKLSLGQRLALFVASIGPGLFLIGYNIGTGSVTTMASTGAQYGLTLVWPVFFSCLFTYFLIVAFGRYTAVTGETAIHAFRRQFGRPVALFVLLALIFTEWVSTMGVMAVMVQVVQEWSRPLTSSGAGFNPVVLAIVFGGALYAFFLDGRYTFFEKLLAIMVAVMGLGFVLTMFMVVQNPADLAAGLIPSIPEEGNAPLLIAGMVGTTMSSVIFVMRSILVKEKKWGPADLRVERRDAFVSAALMFILSVAVMASAAGTLFPKGLHVDNAIDMVMLLEPLAGRFAVSMFVVGLVAAGLSSLFPNYLLAPWLIADYRGRPLDLRGRGARLLALTVVILDLAVPVFGGRPVFVMIVSQAVMTMVSPLVIVLMLILLNRRELMGEHRPTPAMNVALAVILLFATAMAVIGAAGLLNL
ncbi:MAG TPA: Nramp family divalent metal transporter [Rhodothermales bacterium]